MNWRLLIGLPLLLGVIVTAISVVESRQQHRQLSVEMTALEIQRDELNIEFGRLQLEQAALGKTSRIERVAAEQLLMRSPSATEVEVLQP
ncbi:MAG: Cell division protein FtsL [Alphaproteobacteria bacterium ADurb.BinA280]|jgi:cell division protein FtsL|nr:cell division protein FtsL [Xanthomonadales bacterium]MCC6505661.1 cell division protein FtsL [Aquimonas sp.]OPZ14062.1 MAG: Cell division protein FtsL [Alphaproteobacteria bacterium ADurb.BinA280]